MEQVFEADDLRGVLHTPEKANGDALALTHGAGSNSSAPLLVSLSRAFCEAGLIGAALRSAVSRGCAPAADISRGAGARPRRRGAGGAGAAPARAGARVCRRTFLRRPADRHDCGRTRPGLADGLLLLSYPLHPPRKPDQLRTAFFPGVAHARALRPRHARPVRHAWRNCATPWHEFRRAWICWRWKARATT